jgi:alpha-N-arabinofuranosidase
LLAGRANFNAFDQATLPVTAAGNVFTKGSQPSKFETEALLKPDFDPGIKLTHKADGWYLELNTDRKWASEQKRRLVTTALLGKAIIPNQEFTHPDGSPLTIDTDYFGNPRDAANPFPGPFETTADGPREIKVWPKAASSSR